MAETGSEWLDETVERATERSERASTVEKHIISASRYVQIACERAGFPLDCVSITAALSGIEEQATQWTKTDPEESVLIAAKRARRMVARSITSIDEAIFDETGGAPMSLDYAIERAGAIFCDALAIAGIDASGVLFAVEVADRLALSGKSRLCLDRQKWAMRILARAFCVVRGVPYSEGDTFTCDETAEENDDG